MAAIRMAVVGAGSWGTTVASLAAENTPTVLWARRGDVADEINSRHTNTTYLGGRALSSRLEASTSLADTVSSADVVVMAVPSHVFRDTLDEVAAHVRPWVPVVSLTKGLEPGTNLRMTEIVDEVLPGHPVGVLTGPNLSREILDGQAAAAVIALGVPHISEVLQRVFASDLFRVYPNDDVVGCEIAGAVKNVIALASGIADGLGTGDNTRATVITRGFGEMMRIGTALGGRSETLSGLAGMGDLIATCIAAEGRNRSFGEQLGRGR
ncbi:MAG: NAD(P)H-dependent glycerol-3-phosphate dehydrogenase, partial [Ilumatobacteraceae bacterium]